MRKNVLLTIIGVMLISLGLGGYLLSLDKYDQQFNGYGMMNYAWQGDDYQSQGYYGMGPMMGGSYYGIQSNENEEKLELDILTLEVEKYIDQFETNLVIGDIFVFEDSEYYYSIIEESTKKGAMELLINPYTKDIYPEFGPNMMWNLKYGMHNSGYMFGGRGMMSGYGMMGRRGNYSFDYDDYNVNEYSQDNEMNSEEAYNKGVDYLANNKDEYTLGDEYHEFYGYYTFHVESGSNPVGMLSVHGFTGDVWYHTWHGELVEIVDGHDDAGISN